MVGEKQSRALVARLHTDMFGFSNNVISTQDQGNLAHDSTYDILDDECSQRNEVLTVVALVTVTFAMCTLRPVHALDKASCMHAY